MTSSPNCSVWKTRIEPGAVTLIPERERSE
jgi:hypothetical protein